MKITKLPNGGEMRVDGDYQAWYLNGLLHRTDGPAIVYGDRQEWWLNGKLHRTDGPAYVNGDYQAWWLNGQRMTEAQHAEKVAAMPHDECLRPKFKVGEKVRPLDSSLGSVVTEIVIGYRVEEHVNRLLVWAEDELSPLPAHIHQFVCAECGEAK